MMMMDHHPLFYRPSSSTFKPNGPSPSNLTRSDNRRPAATLKFNARQHEESNSRLRESIVTDSLCDHSFCCCGRRRLIEAIGATTFFSVPPPSSIASHSHPEPTDVLNKIHPPRPDWYEEFYASALDKGMKSYGAEVAGYKSQLFTNLRGKAETVLEIGVGTGPNFRYYAGDSGVRVFGIDPNRKMEKYAQAAAVTAGLPPANFQFIQAVAEALPLSDASIDAVVGTLVLCSVREVNVALKEVMRVLKPGGMYLFMEHVAAKDGTILRFVQSVLDPLQQTVSQGCHLTRKTGNNISEAGFSKLDINRAFFATASIIGPHVYGIACK